MSLLVLIFLISTIVYNDVCLKIFNLDFYGFKWDLVVLFQQIDFYILISALK